MSSASVGAPGKAAVLQEYKTFAHRAAAVTWAKHREVVLEDPSALIRVQQVHRNLRDHLEVATELAHP